MAFKEKLEDALFGVEEKFQQIGERSEEKRVAFLNKNVDTVNKLEEARDKTGERLQSVAEKATGLFGRIVGSIEEKKAQMDFKRARK
jgi:hypothetical protein